MFVLLASVGNSLPDPLAPLSQQNYFHGPLSRVEAEALVISNGEFLIRESTKKPGQYVLTGMAADKAQHLLLMDKQGKVRSTQIVNMSQGCVLNFLLCTRVSVWLGA